LFGDGAAATVIAGSEIGGRQGGGARRVIATRYPTERTMGWNVVDSEFKIVLSPAIPKLVREDIQSAYEPNSLPRQGFGPVFVHGAARRAGIGRFSVSRPFNLCPRG
jgi:hypothetical protein